MSLLLDKVSQGYGAAVVVDRLSVTLRPGVTALVGPNGAGKTTLLRTLATVMPPRSGTICLDGVVIDGEQSARRARERVGYLPQDFGFDPHMSVADFVHYAAWLRGVAAGDRRRVVDDALEFVNLADHRRSRMRKLSGGMRQRAGIAWAVVGRPRLVLLDEPTGGLDPRQRLQFRRMIAGLADTIVVLSTHLIDDVAAIGGRAIVFYGGEIRFDGTVNELGALSRDDLPGHTRLERGYMSVLPAKEQRL